MSVLCTLYLAYSVFTELTHRKVGFFVCVCANLIKSLKYFMLIIQIALGIVLGYAIIHNWVFVLAISLQVLRWLWKAALWLLGIGVVIVVFFLAKELGQWARGNPLELIGWIGIPAIIGGLYYLSVIYERIYKHLESKRPDILEAISFSFWPVLYFAMTMASLIFTPDWFVLGMILYGFLIVNTFCIYYIFFKRKPLA